MYPPALAQRERAGFRVQSSLAAVRLECDRPDWVASNFAIRGFYEWTVVAIANQICRPGDAIIEVGANIGTESILYAAIVGTNGRVMCFEPLPENVAMLDRQRKLNHLEQIEIFSNAVGDQHRMLQFVVPESAGNLGQGHLATSGSGKGERTIDVECVRLDDLRREQKIRAPRLLVMDVQGAELAVLKGALELVRETKPYIVLEIELPPGHQNDVAGSETYRILSELGYSLACVTKWGLRDGPKNLDYDINWLAIPPTAPAGTLARLSRKIWLAAVLPLIPGLNPAMIRPA